MRLLLQDLVWSHVSVLDCPESAATQMAALGEGPLHEVWNQVLTSQIQGKPETILSLEVGASIRCIRYIRD
jgi:hypothetical protein